MAATASLTALTLCISAVPAQATNAAKALATCNTGYICVYQVPDYGALTSSGGIGRAVPPGECRPTGSGIRSVQNRTGVTQRLWTNGNCTGWPENIGGNSGRRYLSNVYHSVGGYP
ncbi:peptidase inhibitor family I36 protein [Nonomuraea fuscirosea]|uniref:peptidase inhibitor family I36 protein n=1 Tax=Nonomuraea fuscirosea TaxID=1291556 RepID=UPI0037B5DB37